MPVTPSSSASNGLEIGRRALQAQQAALNTVSHNIANANTPGFSRRRANLESATSGIQGGIGNGVDVGSITRERSRFLDAQVRVEQQVLGRWQSVERSLRGIEAIFNEPAGAGSSETGTVFNEPSGVGLSGSLSRFWNAWQDLANVPESGAARAAVRQEGIFLTTTLHQYQTRLQDMRLELDNEVMAEVAEINEIIGQLAALNAQIPQARFNGGSAADLEDHRDQLLDQLSLKVDIGLTEKEDGQISVLIGGHNLVEREKPVYLRIRQMASNGATAARVSFSDDGSLAVISEGRLRGLTEARDDIVPELLDRLDELAFSMVEEVNLVHRTGFGKDGSKEIDFFDPDKISASNIAVDEAILKDLDNIAASADGNSGDNGIALAVAGLRNRKIVSGDSNTIEEFYNTFLGEIGSRSKEAQTMAENHRLFAEQIDSRRQGLQGVSLNEEAAQLILLQRAYQAAARTVSVIDDLMEVAINL